jgi:excisionase family DNA binding protein
MRDRITVQEAARRLGVKDDAIRKRIQRGTLEHEKDPDGRVFVYLDTTHDASSDEYKDSSRYPSQDSANDGAAQDESYDPAQDRAYVELVEVLRSELDDWKQVVATRDEELRRKDHIIAALTERIPELEPPALPEPREAPEPASEGTVEGATVPPEPQEPSQRRPSWWRRFFGL